MVEKKASDLHIRSGGPAYLRIDGVLYPVGATYTADQVQTLAFSVMAPKPKKVFDERQDCDFSLSGEGGLGRFRFNVFRQKQMMGIVIRHVSNQIPTLEELKLPVQVVQKLAVSKRGIVLVTGTAGSGKSSTLAAMVGYINENRSAHIVTIEDPIEFLHADRKSIITQREVGMDTGSFVEALRSALRQDPDVILLGEMRDLETTQAAMTAAQTGHLVLATIHTIDANQTISRIVDMFPPHQQPQIRIQLADTLKGVISQRLLPSSKGGRIPAIEVLVVTAHIRKLIEENNLVGIVQAMQKGSFYGMQTFNQGMVKLHKDGLVTLENILAAASNPDDVLLAIRGIEQEVESKGGR
ncbi:MAG: PilT/PilU family type 4a pilus ATPase [Elusimicrobia bacterium]|nr:PilT/PilU family type 4a pilus ATPase [Elusimicrobiota bacterium]